MAFMSTIFGKEPAAYIYLLPFDNIQNDPSVEWIASGLRDMVSEEIKSIYGVKIKSKEDKHATSQRVMIENIPEGVPVVLATKVTNNENNVYMY